jgi:hypothetical protein
MIVPYLPICQPQSIKAAFVNNNHYLVPRTDNAETNDKLAQMIFGVAVWQWFCATNKAGH